MTMNIKLIKSIVSKSYLHLEFCTLNLSTLWAKVMMELENEGVQKA